MKLHTADEIVSGKIEGPVRAELIVEGWLKYRGFSPPGESQTFILKQSRPGGDRLDVLVEQKVFDRLRALGIDDPRGHFEGKTVIVVGQVHRNKGPLGDTSITIWVRDLDQIESISKK